MTTVIEIEGNIARTVRREILAESHLSSLAPHLVTYMPHGFPIMPRNPVRHIWFDPNTSKGYMLVEVGPRRHHMRVILGGEHYTFYEERMTTDVHGTWAQFQVQLPFLYFMYGYTVNINQQAGDIRLPTDFTINGSYLFMRPTAWRSPEDLLWPAQVPNVYGDGRICWGYTQTANASLDVRIDDYTNSFWTTFFNHDLGMNTPFGSEVEALQDWENNSEDALAYMQWPVWQRRELASPISILKDVLERGGSEVIMAQLNPSFVAIPDLPHSFTVGRAQEYLASLDPAAHRRFLQALRTVPEPDPEPAPARRRRRAATPANEPPVPT